MPSNTRLWTIPAGSLTTNAITTRKPITNGQIQLGGDCDYGQSALAGATGTATNVSTGFKGIELICVAAGFCSAAAFGSANPHIEQMPLTMRLAHPGQFSSAILQILWEANCWLSRKVWDGDSHHPGGVIKA